MFFATSIQRYTASLHNVRIVAEHGLHLFCGPAAAAAAAAALINARDHFALTRAAKQPGKRKGKAARDT